MVGIAQTVGENEIEIILIAKVSSRSETDFHRR
jgi:hypothetical protein